jgi:glutamate-ammonia-ligase adenylyltransferase
MATTPGNHDFKDALERAENHSPFLRVTLDAHPGLKKILAAGGLEEALTSARNAGADVPELGTALRRERSALALVLAIADLAGALPLEQVVGRLSEFADSALDRAVADMIAQRTPGREPLGFSVIALGKHGSRELNYSSDIDLLLLFDPATLPLKPREEPQQARSASGSA